MVEIPFWLIVTGSAVVCVLSFFLGVFVGALSVISSAMKKK